MKKIISLFFVFYFTYTYAQLPVSQTPSNKNVVLEEFTGMHCTYCPDGHRRAQLIADAHPGRVVLINVHTGSYATPSPGEPDFRTPFGQALASQSQLAGYPAGTVNRHYFGYSQNGSPSGATALGRGQWAQAAQTILDESSYCNVALEASVDVQTREMTINVEVYYTGNSSVSNNYLNVALMQNNVEGPQTGAQLNPNQVLPNGNYNHMHMLRHLITGQWGDQISTVSQGTLVQRQYTYTLPADINGVPLELGNLEIAAFVAEGHQEIISGNLGPITYTNLPYTLNAAIMNVEGNNEICAPSELEPKISVQNNGSTEITSMEITYSVNGGNASTYSWTGSIASLGQKVIELPAIDFQMQANNTLNVQITAVNGTPSDDNADDNSGTYNFDETPYHGTGTDYIVTIVQDQYGDETTWAIVDMNNNILAQGGPYPRLSGSGTQTHTHNVTLNDNNCYKFYIFDSYGDGICCNYGSGNYKLEQSDGTLVFEKDGNFGSQEITSFSVGNPFYVNEEAFNRIEIYPNPSKGIVHISEAKDMKLNILSSMGQVVHTQEINNEEISIDLSTFPAGIYFLQFIQGNNIAIKKILLSK